MSYSKFKTSDLNPIGRLILDILSIFRMADVQHGIGEDKLYTQVNNLTLINFVIKVLGPVHERNLTLIMLFIQVSEEST